LVKTGVMSTALCAAARDRMWECNETAKLRRDDPSSWIGSFGVDDVSDDPANKWGGKRWQLRSVGGEETIIEMLPRACAGMASQLLGPGGFLPATGGQFLGRLDTGAFLAPAGSNTRGIYCTLPQPSDTPRTPLKDQPGIHFDSGATTDDSTDGRFKVTGLIVDTPPGCGGFTLYPRSHTRLYELATSLREEGVESPEEIKSRVAALTQAIAEDTEPVDCHGPCGTVRQYTVQKNGPFSRTKLTTPPPLSIIALLLRGRDGVWRRLSSGTAARHTRWLKTTAM
jgi:hypothetical protein